MADALKPGTPQTVQTVTATHAGGAASIAQLTTGALYSGSVSAHNNNGTYTVTLAKGLEITNVERVMPSFCSLMGLKDLSVLYPGTPVVIAYGIPSFIIGCRDTDIPNVTKGRSTDDRRAVGGAKSAHPQQAAADALSGETEIANSLGVGVRFLTTIMQMSAGERAKVECCLLNDMVRIVSAQFRHISPLGDELMFDHGRPTAEKGWTAYRHELFGLLEDSDPLYDESAMFEDRWKRMGRHRLLEFVGYAGDMVHSFVADPAKALQELTGSTPDEWSAGKSWIHRAMDGSVLVQSVADIRLERVVRIPVPVRIRSHEDPQLKRHYESLSSDLKAYLKTWDKEHPQRMAFQLREYSRWLTRYSAFARFMMHPDEYAVPSEADSASPDPNCGEKDRAGINGDMGPFDTYSVIAINRNGSIVIFGSGASIVMNYGNLHVSASKHLTLESAGDMRFVSGGSIFMKARRHIELTASAGAIIGYSYTAMRWLCEAGALMIRSCMQPKDSTTPAGPRYEARDNGDAELQPDIQTDAIIIEAPASRAVVRAYAGITLATEKKPTTEEKTDPEAVSGEILISASGNIRTKSGIATTIAAVQDIVLSTKRYLATTVKAWVGRMQSVSWNDGAIHMKPSSGLLSCRAVDTDTMSAYGRIYGPDQGVTARKDQRTNVPYHLNHINFFVKANEDDPNPTRPLPDVDEEAAALLGKSMSAPTKNLVPWTSTNDGPKWRFLPAAAYNWSREEGVQGALTETLTQQLVRLEVDEASAGNWLDWEWNGKTFSSSTASWRLDANAGKSFGQDAAIFFQENDAAFPTLFKPSDKTAADYKTALASVNSHWTQDAHVTFKVYRPS